MALSGCASTHVLRDFTTDGCSLFPDGDVVGTLQWRDCCVNHDKAYWRGGTAKERLHADAKLRDCVQTHSDRTAQATLMYWGVRIGGTPWLPTRFRWAYGWGYGRGYEPLSLDEQKQADEKISAYFPSRSKIFCEKHDS